jgi:RND family efflux transporter MFP subunit
LINTCLYKIIPMKKYNTLLFTALVALAFTSCKDKQATQPPALPPTPVAVAVAQNEEAVYYDQYQGTVVSVNNVELRSAVTGFITGIYFKEGDIVPKGKTLYEIDRRKYQAAFAQANANLMSAQANLSKAQKDIDRYNMLLKNDAVARQTVDQATATYEMSRSQVEVARAMVASAKTDLSYSLITAPVTGRIGISQVRLGSQVSPGTTLLNTISSENPIAVDVVINEQDINRFYELQKKVTDSTFRLQLSDGTEYNRTGKILAIDRGVNNLTGTIKVRVQFANPDGELKDGMSCVLKVLNNDSGNRLQIPYKAVSEQMGEFFVFVAQDTIARQQKITLGPRIGSNIVVMDGIKSGDKIVTDGFQRLRDGGKITTADPFKPAAGAQTDQKAK